MQNESPSPSSPPPSSLAFLNLRYSVTNYGQVGWPKKALLRRLNGSFHAGSLNGLLGESGSGKTTLLSALSGKSTSGLSPSTSLYLGRTVCKLKNTGSYFVQQHILETIEGSLTIGQLLQYAFLFKNGLSREVRAKMEGHIELVTKKLLLNSDSLMKRRFSVCSGGEQRRVSVAQELMNLSPPDFLFLDEPTTGLDSYAALELVKCLSELTLSSSDKNSSRLTIIASIHAPSSELLTFFSKLYVLAKGVAIFSGPPHTLKAVLEDQLGKGVVGKGELPIEALIRISCSDLENEEGSQRLQKLAQHALQTEYEAVTREIASCSFLPSPSGLPNARKVFTFGDLYLATCRHFRVTFIANAGEVAAQLTFLLLTIGAFSTFYNSPAMVLPDGCYKRPSNSTSEAQCSSDRGGGGSVLRDFHLTENINFQSLNRDDNVIIIQLLCALLYSRLAKVFRSEHRNRWYSLGVFYLSSDIITSLQILLFTLFISVFSYFVVSEHAIDGYQVHWARLGHFTACTGLYLAHSQALGQLNGVLFAGSQEMTVVAAFFFNTLHLLLNDFFFKTADVSLYGYRLVADLLGMKHITRYLVYIFYGLDRCNEEKGEASWVLEKYDVPQFEQLMLDLLWVIVLKTVLMKVFTFALLFGRFGSFGIWRWFMGKRLETDCTEPVPELPNLLPIDFPTSVRSSKTENGFHANGSRTAKHKLKKVSVIKTDLKIIIAWRNLSLLKSQPTFEINRYTSLNSKKVTSSQPEMVLNNLNGAFTFGSLNAVMGMSGAGKTTFLRLLNGQEHCRLSPSSALYVSNGTPISTVFLTQEVDGHLMKGLTARQLLIYASKLKNSSQKNVDHNKIALGLLEELNLSAAASTKVQSLSGGEKKRLALASELTSTVMPNLILVDEICSGLDSNSAAVTISTLRTFTHCHPLTIVVSIHQPNSELLSLFDSLYVLSSGGHAVYSGPPDGIQGHLNKLLLSSTTAEKSEELFTNDEFPIETLIKYSSLRVESSAVVRQLETITRLATTESKLEKKLLEETIPLEDDSVLVNRVRFSLHSVLHLSSRYFAFMVGHHFLRQWLPFALFYLFYAVNLHFFFNPHIASASGCISIEADLFNTTISSCSAEAKSQAEEEKLLLENVVYNFFFSCFFLLIVLMQTPIALFYELPLLANEHRNGWYSTGSWYVSKMIFEMLPLIPILAIYVYLVDIFEEVLKPGVSLYWTIFWVMLLSVATAHGFTYLVLLAMDAQFTTSLVLGLTSMIVMIQLSNVFSPLATAHYIHRGLSYLAIPRWPLQALMVAQYGFGRCLEREVQPILSYMGLEDEDFAVAIAWMVFNVLLYKGVAFWWLVRRMNSAKGGGGSRRRKVVYKEVSV